MDMRKKLKRWLNLEVLRAMPDERYVGTIEYVREELVRNPWTHQTELLPVVKFEDGYRWSPGEAMKRALIAMLGPETDDWPGHTIALTHHQAERLTKAGKLKHVDTWVLVRENDGPADTTA